MRSREFIRKTNIKNDGSRLINESILVREVELAFNDWVKNAVDAEYTIIGGIALSYYTRPRTTTDVDTLFIDKSTIPQSINKFRRSRAGAFQHNQTHVEIEVLTPQYVNMDPQLAKAIIDNSNTINGVRVASPAGLVASKLIRFKLQDQADIESLLDYDSNIDLSIYPLDTTLLNKFNQLKTQLGYD